MNKYTPGTILYQFNEQGWFIYKVRVREVIGDIIIYVEQANGYYPNQIDYAANLFNSGFRKTKEETVAVYQRKLEENLETIKTYFSKSDEVPF